VREVVVVVDSTKLNQLARFCLTCRGVIRDVFLSGKAKGYRFVSTTTNFRRALQAFIRGLPEGMDLSAVSKLYVKEAFLLLDAVVPKKFYLSSLSLAKELLEDEDYEFEDAQALALAVELKREGFEVFLWTNDKDFLSKSSKIEETTGVKVIKLL